jgi:hypothetical protein
MKTSAGGMAIGATMRLERRVTAARSIWRAWRDRFERFLAARVEG